MATADLTPGVLDIEGTQGDDLSLSLTFKNPDGSLYDLSGFSSWGVAADPDDYTDTQSFDVDLTSVASSVVAIHLAGSSTALFRRATWAVVALDTDSKRITLIAGTIKLDPKPDVTF